MVRKGEREDEKKEEKEKVKHVTVRISKDIVKRIRETKEAKEAIEGGYFGLTRFVRGVLLDYTETEEEHEQTRKEMLEKMSTEDLEVFSLYLWDAYRAIDTELKKREKKLSGKNAR